jgi:hypothetical protein
MRIDIDVPDGISGNWKVETFEVKDRDFSQMISMFKTAAGSCQSGIRNRCTIPRAERY